MSTQDNLKKGTAEMLVLHLLCSGERYGYQITQELADLSCGRITLQEGSLYPTLHRILKEGYVSDRVEIAEETQKLRKYYQITPEGRERLRQLREDYDNIIDGISMILMNGKGVAWHP